MTAVWNGSILCASVKKIKRPDSGTVGLVIIGYILSYSMDILSWAYRNKTKVTVRIVKSRNQERMDHQFEDWAHTTVNRVMMTGKNTVYQSFTLF